MKQTKQTRKHDKSGFSTHRPIRKWQHHGKLEVKKKKKKMATGFFGHLLKGDDVEVSSSCIKSEKKLRLSGTHFFTWTLGFIPSAIFSRGFQNGFLCGEKGSVSDKTLRSLGTCEVNDNHRTPSSARKPTNPWIPG